MSRSSALPGGYETDDANSAKNEYASVGPRRARKAVDELETIFDCSWDEMVASGVDAPGFGQAPPFLAQPNIGKYQWVADRYGRKAPLSKAAVKPNTPEIPSQSKSDVGANAKAKALAMAMADKRAPRPDDAERTDAHCLSSHPQPQMLSNYAAYPDASINPYTGTRSAYDPCGAYIAPRPPINLGYEYSIANGEMAAMGGMPLQQQAQTAPQMYHPMQQMYSMQQMQPMQQMQYPAGAGGAQEVRYIPVQVASNPVPYSIGPQVIRPPNPYFVNWTPSDAPSEGFYPLQLQQVAATRTTRSPNPETTSEKSAEPWRQAATMFAVGALALIGMDIVTWFCKKGSRGRSYHRSSRFVPHTPTSVPF